ncbi:SAC3 family protein C isoform X1 [Phoenix dactylifera]|uniref:SAC3 family protein C isoform X1 n=1 Tax=Phoenix dactylifera TaxID=42345 RepID=A0A8B7CCF4_PHODC|nr:SAC3 family protein C isoform X1 [Phoenix dactylifera]
MEKKNRSRADKSGFQRARETRRNPPSSSNSWKFRPPARKEPHAAVEQSSDPSSSIRERSHNDGNLYSPNAPALVGTCPDMCPEKERAQRERLRDLAVFERLDGNLARTSPGLAVKKFCRTISTIHIQASDIRPLPVLQNTLKYLLDLMDSPEYPFEVVHDFIFDRTRSIRQDLSIQNMINDQAICMYEDMVKFHIISHKKLGRCCGKSDVSSLCYLNMEQLMKCLLSLFDMYDINQRSKSIGKNAAEFYSFYVLLHLGYKIPKMGDSLSFWYSQLALPILQSKEMCFARSLLRYSQVGNYKRLFSTIAAEASDLQLCLLEPFLNEVRGQALSYISYSSYKLQPYPLRDLCKILMIKEADLESLCYECGLETSTDEGGSKFLPAKQTSFRLPKPGFQSYSLFNSEKNHR